ncbi:MAG: DNA gyrase subunit A, partial [Erysipelotrichaceae bacterium]|nr:DNA gyrase subunit A [Erysipelotrichaceae bacterium]
PLVSLKAVRGDEDCLLMTSDGIVIRFSLKDVSTTGRATQGVRLVKPGEDAYVSAVTILDLTMNPDFKEEENGTETVISEEENDTEEK